MGTSDHQWMSESETQHHNKFNLQLAWPLGKRLLMFEQKVIR